MSNENEKQVVNKETAFPFGLNYSGLSKREWFAGQALIGLSQGIATAKDAHTPYQIKNVVTLSYRLADEMLKNS